MTDGGSDGVPVERELSQVGAELRALFSSTRVTVLLVVTAGLVVLQAWALTRFLGSASRAGGDTMMGISDIVQILASVTATGVLGVFVLGALAPWASSRRDEVGAEVTAKAVAHVIVALIYGAVAVGLVIVTFMVARAVEGSEPTDLMKSEVFQAGLGSLVVYPLWALIGLGVGALVGSPVVAVAVGLFWPHVEATFRYLFADSLATATTTAYLPLGATSILATGGARLTPTVVMGGNAGTAAVTLAIYTAVILGAGALATFLRRPADDGDGDGPADPAPDPDPDAALI